MRNVSGLEAAYRDFGPKGVKFYFIYKTLAHPELVGSYVQPFTLEERVTHARRAEKQLGSTIPWIVDSMDNRLKHALGDRANSEYIIDPDGAIVRKRAWSDPDAVRKDLTELVGPVEKPTNPDDLGLKAVAAETKTEGKEGDAGKSAPRVSRLGMFPLRTMPVFDPDGKPFYVKLRCEADLTVMDQGHGKMYLGFHLDPLYEVHWNHLNAPPRFELQATEGIKLSQTAGQATPVSVETDTDPREFLLDVIEWPEDKELRLTVTYFACTDELCHAVRQSYVIHRKRDADGGAARGAAFRGMTTESMLKMLMSGDKNRDGKISESELNSIQRPRFADFDIDKDGMLDQKEIQALAERTNTSRDF